MINMMISEAQGRIGCSDALLFWWTSSLRCKAVILEDVGIDAVDRKCFLSTIKI